MMSGTKSDMYPTKLPNEVGSFFDQLMDFYTQKVSNPKGQVNKKLVNVADLIYTVREQASVPESKELFYIYFLSWIGKEISPSVPPSFAPEIKEAMDIISRINHLEAMCQ